MYLSIGYSFCQFILHRDRKKTLVWVYFVQELFQKTKPCYLLQCDNVECKSELLFCTVEYTFI